MKRIIKFRAYCKEINKMVYFKIGEKPHWYNEKLLGIDDTNEELGWDILSEPMQFTGLKDKNGKETYEGDILKYRYPHAPENEHGQIKEIKWVGYRYDITDRCSKNWEVIGNVYMNPDLLK